MLGLGLRLADDLLGAATPDTATRKMSRDPVVAALATRVAARLLGGQLPLDSGLDQLRFHLRARERLGDRLRYCLRLPVTPSERDWASGSTGWLLPLARRPLRLLREHGLAPRRPG
jgi:hypothetical protein